MDGYQVASLDSVIEDVDIFVTATGNTRVITPEHILRMKNLAVVANIGHFDDEIDMAGISRIPGVKRIEIKPQVHEWVLPNGKSVLILSEGRLMNLGNATGHPSFVMSTSFSNQVLAQIELFTNTDSYPLGVHFIPKHLDEKVARLHLQPLGVELTELTPEQSRYIGVPINGPFKVDHYRY
jgi:adenosylhomocysteinase